MKRKYKVVESRFGFEIYRKLYPWWYYCDTQLTLEAAEHWIERQLDPKTKPQEWRYTVTEGKVIKGK